jgi:hypothetical protein
VERQAYNLFPDRADFSQFQLRVNFHNRRESSSFNTPLTSGFSVPARLLKGSSGGQAYL